MSRACTIALIAFFLGLIFHQGAFWQQISAPDGRVMAPLQSSRTQLGDEYYYSILSKKAPLHAAGLLSSEQASPFFSQNSGLENIYSGALLVAGLLDMAAHALPLSWPFKTVFSFILQAALLMAALMTAYSALRKDTRIPWVELMLFAFAWSFFNAGFIHGVYAGNVFALFTTEALSYYPNILRLVNPQMGWAYGLFYTALLISYYKNPTARNYAFFLMASLLLGAFSIPMTVMFIMGLGLAGFVTLLRHKKLDMPLLGVGVALLVSFLYIRHQLGLFYLTEKGQELGTGSFIGFHFYPHYLLLLVLLPIIRKFTPDPAKTPLTCIYVAALFIGCISPSFELGSRLWLRGSGGFVWLMVAYGLSEWLRLRFHPFWNRMILRSFVPPVLAFAMAVVAFIALDIRFNSWNGYIEQEKADMVTWLRENTTRQDVVLSADLEDAYLIPLYTNAQPYVQLFDYGVLTPNEAILRYFRALDITGLKDSYLSRIRAYTLPQHTKDIQNVASRPSERMPYENYQTYAFFSAVVYYPYVASMKDIYESDVQTAAFHKKMTEMAKSARARDIQKADYILLQKSAGMKLPAGYVSRYENALYQIASPVKPVLVN